MSAKNMALCLSLSLLVVAASLPALAQLPISVGNYPDGLGINGITNNIFVTDFGGSAVSVIDGQTFTVVGTVSVGLGPQYVAVNSATNKVYVPSCGSDPNCDSPGILNVIDGATLRTQSVTLGVSPTGVAVNPVTNMIYVSNYCGNDPTCSSLATVTVINGATLSTQTVNIPNQAYSIAVNSATNKIYVLNLNLGGNGWVTVIDGATLSTQTVPVGVGPTAVAINQQTNKIFVVNLCGEDPNCHSNGTLSVIDGATLATQEFNLEFFPRRVTVDPIRSLVYVGTDCGSDPNCASGPTVDVIPENGFGFAVSVCSVGTAPGVMAMDPVTNQLYIPCRQMNNQGQSGVTILDGSSFLGSTYSFGTRVWQAAVDQTTNTVYVSDPDGNVVWAFYGFAPAPSQFVSVPPCRLVDTRGGNPIQGDTSQSFPLPQLGGCNIPDSATAYSLNVTVAPHRPLGYLTIWPTGQDQPFVSTMNSLDGRIKANAAIVPAGYRGAVSVFATDTTDVILDINGYFAPAGQSTYQFYPLTPCRVVDTRQSNFPSGLGAPSFHNMEARRLPVLANSPCLQNLGRQPRAYSFNVTAAPEPAGQPLGYLTIWPSDQQQPLVSTLNNPTATVVANAAIVPAAANGDVSVFTFNSTDVIIDVNGYYAAPGQGGYSFYPMAPCRAYDSRNHGGQPFMGERAVNVGQSVCVTDPSAQAYVLNATVVPDGFLDYLTLWPDGLMQPFASTLNAYDGLITSNMAIIPTTNGSIDAYASQLTHLILDISGYFAP